jgi:hypothetical protein
LFRKLTTCNNSKAQLWQTKLCFKTSWLLYTGRPIKGSNKLLFFLLLQDYNHNCTYTIVVLIYTYKSQLMSQFHIPFTDYLGKFISHRTPIIRSLLYLVLHPAVTQQNFVFTTTY